MRKPSAAGGWHAIRYTLKKAREVGGTFKLYKALRTKNACKTCALGMGGQKGGMVNERGSFPEVCKKSIQAMASDMQNAITADFWSKFSIEQMKRWTPRQLEVSGRLIQPVLYEEGATHFRTITWSEAFARIVAKLKSLTPTRPFGTSVAEAAMKPDSFFSCSLGSTVPTTSTTAATIAIKPAAWGSV